MSLSACRLIANDDAITRTMGASTQKNRSKHARRLLLRSVQPMSVPLARADKVGAGYEFKLKLLNPGLAGSKPRRIYRDASARPPHDCLISRAAHVYALSLLGI